MKCKLFFTPYRLFLAHAVAKGAQLPAQSQIVTVAVDDEFCLFETQLAAFVQQAFIHITGHHFGKEQIVAAIESLGVPATIRGEALDLQQFAQLANYFTENCK